MASGMGEIGNIGSIGNIGMMVGAALGIGIAAIILLTFAPSIIGDMNGIHMFGKNTCEVNGERIDVVVAKGTHKTADAAWTAGTAVAVSDCTAAADATNIGSNTKFYTPKGAEVTAAVASNAITGFTGGTAKTAAKSVKALGDGRLANLITAVMCILVPVGAIAFLAYVGGELVSGYAGGGILGRAIGVTVIVVLVGALLPEIFTPLDNLYNVLDGKRYTVFASGVGRIAGVVGDFLAISLYAGIVALGVMLWKGRSTSGDMG